GQHPVRFHRGSGAGLNLKFTAMIRRLRAPFLLFAAPLTSALGRNKSQRLLACQIIKPYLQFV
ncbi:hypothetical protein, partial [Serratia marcescens]|uniref:hypothetical protein n=1 Tax=Serratia marcescens TaxID=615 RepID=UPI002B0585D6